MGKTYLLQHKLSKDKANEKFKEALEEAKQDNKQIKQYRNELFYAFAILSQLKNSSYTVKIISQAITDSKERIKNDKCKSKR